jgi:hypothetical protein
MPSGINTLALPIFHSLLQKTLNEDTEDIRREDRDQYQTRDKHKKPKTRTDNVHPQHHPLAPLLSSTLHEYRALPGCDYYAFKHDDDDGRRSWNRRGYQYRGWESHEPVRLSGRRADFPRSGFGRVCPVCKAEEAGEVAREEEISVIGIRVGVGVEVEVEVADDGSRRNDDAEVGLGAEVEDDGDDGSMDGHREAREAETLAALSWETYFDRYGWVG